MVVVGVIVSKRKELMEELAYDRPVRLNEAFQKAVAGADRIVIRKGGFDCCESVDQDTVLATIKGVEQVRAIASRFKYAPDEVANSRELAMCMCCGYPGIDWYRGNKRVALTSVHHGKSLRWKGFSTTRVLGVTVDYGDAPMTADTRTWLQAWLIEHGASEAQNDQGTNSTAKPAAQQTGASGFAQETNSVPSEAGSRR